MSYLVNNELLMTIKWKWIKHLTRNILVLYIILIRNIFSDISVSVGLFSILFCPQTKAGSQPRFSYISEYQFRCRRPQCVHWSEVTTAEKIAVAGSPLPLHLLPSPWKSHVPHLVRLSVEGTRGSSSRQSICIHLLWECPWLAVCRMGREQHRIH